VDFLLAERLENTMHFQRLWQLLGIVYIATILIVSLVRIPDINQSFSYTDKVIHFVSYFILVGWFVQLYYKFASRLRILLAAILFGMVIEFLQEMTAYRSFDYVDQIANSLGAFCAFLLAKTDFDTLLGRFDLWLYRLKQ